MGLSDMAPNDLANLLTDGPAAVGSILFICFKSKCTKISLCFGLWSCDRNVINGSDEENPRIGVTCGKPEPDMARLLNESAHCGRLSDGEVEWELATIEALLQRVRALV